MHEQTSSAGIICARRIQAKLNIHNISTFRFFYIKLICVLCLYPIKYSQVCRTDEREGGASS